MPHIHEWYDFTVGFLIVHDDKVLLVNHPRYDKWLPPGGHIELHEDPEEALLREIEEETGLAVTILSDRLPFESPGTKSILQPAYVDVHEANPPHKHIGLMYFVCAKTAQARLSDEHTDIKWFAAEELHDLRYKLSRAIIFYAEAALEKARQT